MPRRPELVAGGMLLATAIVVGGFLLARDEEKSAKPKGTISIRVGPRVQRVHGLAARIPAGRRVALRIGPGGPVLARISWLTEFGSPQTVAVVERSGNWLAVRSPDLDNDEVGWVNAKSAGLSLVRRPVSLEVDLSRRELVVRGPQEVERRISVAIGAADTPTPPGEFYVTDKLRGADFGSYYGCCILALSGRQPNLPRGWSGGDRLAIHGSPTATWGHAVSNGCLHADEADLRYLMKTVPLGTAVQVHA